MIFLKAAFSRQFPGKGLVSIWAGIKYNAIVVLWNLSGLIQEGRDAG